MQKVFIRLALYLVGLGLALFIGVFIWANWTPLSPGERAEPVNFITYDVTNLNSDAKASEISSYVNSIEGVGGTTNVPVMKSIIVIYRILDITEEEIIASVKEKFNYQLTQKKFADNGKRCPVSGTLSTMSRVRRSLNIRG